MIADEELLKQLAENIYGPVAGKIIELLIKKGEATDEEIAKYTDIGINDARRLLNFLFEANLVKYRRIRDENDNSKIIEKLKKNYEKLKEAGENFLVPFKLTENME
ncbi:MAG: hypothetical protein B6U95_00980 [Thermofilum sp. ex4484_82]|nr:MAG: hypothetical protein B6U95_00980 [Thermofilum sp. ex4484_82]OYT39974.1 MAG: hypothetical protein B6U96_00985 [Archaeoglobales archaeon ex4484_92]